MPKKKTPALPRPVPLTPQDVRHIRELWLQGLSVAELAEKFEQSREFMWGVLEGERPPATPESPRIIECSFCGGTQHECVMLVAGPRSYICDQCVKLCLEIIMEARPGYVRIEIGPPDSSQPSASDGGDREG